MPVRTLLVALVAALALTVVPAAAPAPALAKRPNIVFVLTDDLASNLIKYMPHVKAMRRHGVSFSRYVVSNSLCCPSRASIFTGQYPHNTGVLGNLPPTGGFEAFQSTGDEGHTFATALQGAGYATGFMGKYMNDYEARSFPGATTGYVPPGWTDWNGVGNGYPGFGYSMNINGTAVRYGQRPEDYLTDVMAARGTAFIDRSVAAGQPFLLELSTFAPHKPYVPASRDAHSFPGLNAPRGPSFNRRNTDPPGWLARRKLLGPDAISQLDTDFRNRVRSVQAVDDMLGQVERTLETHGIADDTYVVFSSDNGYHMGEHALAPGKQTAFDTDIRVPLIVTGPRVPDGRTVSRLTQNTDLRPTFGRLAHVPFRRSLVDGQSLVPFLRGHKVRRWRTAALVEHLGPDTNPVDPDNQGKLAGAPASYDALRTADSTYVEYANGQHEYYDLLSDPLQMHNTYGRLPDPRRNHLHRVLEALRDCRGTGSCLQAARTR
jgi:N-acetylglucosamine-6-sulfatase